MRVVWLFELVERGVARSEDRSKSCFCSFRIMFLISASRAGLFDTNSARKEISSCTSPDAIILGSDLLTGVLSVSVVLPRSPVRV